MSFIERIKERAKQDVKTIVLPESMDRRTYEAAEIILKEKIANLIIIGTKSYVEEQSRGFDITGATILDPTTNSKTQNYIDVFYELRKNKGMTLEKAKETLLGDYMYYACMMVKLGDADGVVSGACHSTASTLKPSLQIIKAKSFEMLVEEHPICALLSHSTKGSAKHPDVDKVVEATNILKRDYSYLDADGELQVDAAIIPEVAAFKAPGSSIAGKANVLIFPDLDAGNIGYKLVERLGKAEAYGPLTQGMAKPVNDLSRGCSARDIVGVVAITAVQAQNN